MSKKIVLCIGIVLTAALLSVGCTQDPTETPSPDGKPGKKVIVALQLRIPKAASPIPVPKLSSALASRAGNTQQPFQLEFEEPQVTPQTRSAGTTKLYNLWLFQFNADGSINGLPQKVSDEATAINDMVLIDVPLVVAKDQTLYLVAMGRQIDENPSTIRTFSDLENFSFGYTTSKAGISRSKITSEDDMPFAGYIKGATVVEMPTGENRGQIEYNTPDGFTGGISIRRLMAKVTLRYKFEVPGYKLQGLRLMNANATVRVTNPAKNDDTDTYFPLEGEMSADTDADGFYSVTWFMAQNQQGNVDEILTESDRYYYVENTTAFGKAPVLGTNIEAWAYKVDASDSYAIYQMYLGKNSPSNFDVTHNTDYNIRTTINTDVESAKTDGRVRPFDAKLTTSLRATGHETGSDNTDKNDGITGGATYDFDAHYDSRQIDIFTKGRIVKIGIYEDKAHTRLANPATSWLKISSSKNYTEAYNNAAEPLSTSITTDVIQLPTKLTFYLYNEEYLVDENGNYFDYTKAAPGSPNSPTGNERRLYVWVETTTEGVTAEKIERYSVTYWFHQRPAIYAGRMGGKLENMQYQTGLCSEQILESNVQYTEEKITQLSSLPIGYTNQVLQEKPSYSGVRDAWNGRLATIQMVNNPDRLPVNQASSGTQNFKNPVIRPDGHPMLYQYGRHNSYGARYCYDKNRDNNGNGYLDEDEIVWYMPAVYQACGTKLWMYGNYGDNVTTMLTSTMFKNTASYVQLSLDNVDLALAHSIRCVREYQPANLSKEHLYIYQDERGNQYGAIDASTMPNTEDRSLDANPDPDIYVTLPLYTYTIDGTNPEKILDSEGKQIYVKRVRRHYAKNAIAGKASVNMRVSANFLIASTHITPEGAPAGDADCYMPWADAMGYLASANTTKPEIGVGADGSSAVERGCPMYRGKDGQDPIGSWRVPTVREMQLISIYHDQYDKICASIDSKPFLKPTSSGSSEKNMYWMSAENDITRAWSMCLFQDLAVLPFSSGSSRGNLKAANTGNNKAHAVRCIRDLPPRP